MSDEKPMTLEIGPKNWSDMVGLLIRVLDTGDRGKAREMVLMEMQRMAKVADLSKDLVDMCKELCMVISSGNDREQDKAVARANILCERIKM